MRLDKDTIEVFKISVQDDPFGGFTDTLVSLGTINGLVAPTSEELTIGANNQIVKESIVKLYTKDDIPLGVQRVKANGILYTITSFADYGSIKLFKLKEID